MAKFGMATQVEIFTKILPDMYLWIRKILLDFESENEKFS